MGTSPDILAPLLRRLEPRASLDEEDRRAFLALPYRLRVVEAATPITREGEAPDQVCVIASGFVYRHKVTAEGARQILSVHLAGDIVDLEIALLRIADHNIQALTRCELACIPRAAVRDLVLTRPRIAAALWIETLIDGAISREWVVNVGRRDARARLAHLLCELAWRFEAVGLATEQGFELPMTQEQLADAVGLTPVHVNRILKILVRDGLIERDRRSVRIADWEGLCAAGGFSDLYLRPDRSPAPARPGISQV
jgi:CRP-like cAMP-binding protein